MKSFNEIELKSILTKEQYEKLFMELPKRMKLINEETLHTIRYRPGDVRLRYSDKTQEIVCKDGNPTDISRKEMIIPLASRKELDYFSQLFNLLNFKADPSWIKHKREFEYKLNGFTYIVCLQHIENFAYILEVEHLSKTAYTRAHEHNIRTIFRKLNCEPIKPEEFTQRIKEYIKANSYKKLS